MPASLNAITALFGIFTFAFGAAWFIPLVTANLDNKRAQQSSEEPIHILTILFDTVLIVSDSIPIFWMLRLLSLKKGSFSAAHQKWLNEKSIRYCFFLSIASLALFATSIGFALKYPK